MRMLRRPGRAATPPTNANSPSPCGKTFGWQKLGGKRTFGGLLGYSAVHTAVHKVPGGRQAGQGEAITVLVVEAFFVFMFFVYMV
jgi:hypothetical protein